MPFRARLKKTFSRTSSHSPSRSTDETNGQNTALYYQPGEKLPLKYKRTVEKHHQDKLDAFSFAKAWRRKSHQSQYSPMGSKLPSRRSSSIPGPSAARKSSSIAERSAGTAAADVTDDSIPKSSILDSAYVADRLELPKLEEVSSPAEKSTPDHINEDPFTQEELTLAVQRSQLGNTVMT